MTSKVALVTGASSGFGRLTAVALRREGYRVFGTSLNEQETLPEGVEPSVLDVRSDQSVQSCIERLLSLTDRIDLLVNNAGQAHASLIEETSMAQARDIFETNFWGVIRVTNAVLPTMRRQRSGHIVNVSSVAGLIGIVGQGFYSASKFALEGYTETLSVEVEPFGIKVSLVEPGFFRTNLHRSMSNSANDISDYASMRNAIETSIQDAISHGGNPERVAELIVRIAQTASPHLRYRVGSEAL